MKVSYLIKNLENMLEKHGDIKVMYWSPRMDDDDAKQINGNIDVVQFEPADIRAGRKDNCILLGE